MCACVYGWLCERLLHKSALCQQVVSDLRPLYLNRPEYDRTADVVIGVILCRNVDLFAVHLKDAAFKTIENDSRSCTGGHTLALNLGVTKRATLIALFQWSPLNGREAGGSTLQDTSAGVAFQNEKLKP